MKWEKCGRPVEERNTVKSGETPTCGTGEEKSDVVENRVTGESTVWFNL